MPNVQKKLLLALALLLGVQAITTLFAYLAEVKGGSFGGDFIDFWQAARWLRQGNIAAIYDTALLHKALTPGQGLPEVLVWFVYPPPLLFALWPLGNMTYHEAVLWWSVLPLPIFAGLLFILLRQSELALEPKKSRYAAYVVAFAATLPFLCANLFAGQSGMFVAVWFMAAMASWRRFPIVAGICIGMLTIKPHLGLMLPVALLASRNWRIIIVACLTFACLVVTTSVWLGGDIWPHYLEAAHLFGQLMGMGLSNFYKLAMGPYVSLQGVGLPSWLAGLVQAGLALAVAAAIARAFWREDGSLWRFGLLATGALLATPYVQCYDTPLLAVALVPLLAAAWRRGWTLLEMLAFCCAVVMPYAQPVLMAHHVPFAFLSILLLFWVLYQRWRCESNPTNSIEIAA